MNLAEIRRKAQQQESPRTGWEDTPAPLTVDPPAAPCEPALDLMPVPSCEGSCLPVPAAPGEALPHPVLECTLDSDYLEEIDDAGDLEALDAYALAAQKNWDDLCDSPVAAVAGRSEDRFEEALEEALHEAPAQEAQLSELPVPVPVPVAPSAPAPVPASADVAAPPLPQRGAQPFDPLAAIVKGRESAATGEESGTVAEEESAETVELLCFKVAKEEYAISIMDVKEIIKPRELTEVPRTPPFVGGILSLRGIIIPVFDLRVRLGLTHGERSPRERIVVVKRERGFCGVLVDQVVQVVRLPLAGFEPPPVVLEGIDRDFVRGIGRVEGRMLILLDMEKVLDVTLS